MAANAAVGSARAPLVWDGAVRIVHWLIAALFVVAWVTHRTNLHWHRLAGYALLTLVLFRIYWGFAGSYTARFGTFLKGPRAVLAYARTPLRRGPPGHAGHNPLGAISVVLLIGLLLAQCVLGLFVTDVDGLESGPLSAHVSFETGRVLSEWHARGFLALKLLVAVHLAAILFYRFAKRDDLVTPMLTGRKPAAEVPPLAAGSGWRAIAGFAVIAALVAAMLRYG